MIILEGKSVCSGISFGRIRFLEEPELEIVRHPITDADAELKRFKSALKIVDAELGELYEKALNEAGTESAQIFEIHRMILEDEDYLEAIEKGITDGMTNAEYVVFETGEKFAGIFSKMEDEYMKGREADVRDISNRLISVLSGAGKPSCDWEEPVYSRRQILLRVRLYSSTSPKLRLLPQGSARRVRTLLSLREL